MLRKASTYAYKHQIGDLSTITIELKLMEQGQAKKPVDELLEKIVSDNAELFELLSTNGNSRNGRK